MWKLVYRVIQWWIDREGITSDPYQDGADWARDMVFGQRFPVHFTVDVLHMYDVNTDYDFEFNKGALYAISYIVKHCEEDLI